MKAKTIVFLAAVLASTAALADTFGALRTTDNKPVGLAYLAKHDPAATCTFEDTKVKLGDTIIAQGKPTMVMVCVNSPSGGVFYLVPISQYQEIGGGVIPSQYK